MISLASMLMHKPAPEQPTKRTAYSSENVLHSLEKNASKPCSACGNPERHRAKSGRIYTTLCTKCYRESNRSGKRKFKPKIEQEFVIPEFEDQGESNGQG